MTSTQERVDSVGLTGTGSSMDGTSASRFESRAKVTGSALYAADNTLPGLLHGILVGAPGAPGSVTSIDVEAAMAVAGVVRVVTRADLPIFGKVSPPGAAVINLPLQDDQVRYDGEPVAVIIAETLEAAEAARPLIKVHMAMGDPVLRGSGEREPAPEGPVGGTFDKGDFHAAFPAAAHQIDVTYLQPARHHNTMETSATCATWDGNRLTLWDAVQASSMVVPVLAQALQIEPANIQLYAPHTGGGFGAKAFVWPHQILTAACARLLGRPLRIQLRRSDQYVGIGYQPHITQRVSLGADADGTLVALQHHVVNTTALAETYAEPATEAKAVYACPNISTRQEIERVSVNMPTPLRAPMEGCGLWAIEGAMNELAATTSIDPMELRLRNHADEDPVTGRPWSSKKLREAYAEGAKLFGWADRHDGSRWDGPWRIGTGMATCSMGTFRFAGGARVRLRDDGTALVESDVQDIGTGIQTVLRKIVADELDLPLERVFLRWGDSSLPVTGPLYGSGGTMHTGSAVTLACRQIREKLAARSDRTPALAALLDAGLAEISAQGSSMPPGGQPMDIDGGESGYAMRTFGAVFVEVGVDPDLGLLRLRRAVGSYSVGRVMSPRTARSQMIGAIAWGWGKATMERSEVDPASGRWLSKNLSGVHIPVNADIPSDITVHFVDEFDRHASVIGAKGIGELGATGVDAAVADAVFDAVGVRLRELPITPARLLDASSGVDR